MTGSLPSGWELAPISALCDINPKHRSDLPGETEVSFAPMAAVDDVHGELDPSTVRRFEDVRKGFAHFAEGDVLFAKITPCMENGNVAVARNLKNGLGCATTELVVLRSRGAIVPEFLHRFLRQESYRRQARAAMTGVVGQARVPREFIEQTEVPLPPLAEQKRIVAKLEELTARSRRAKEALDAVPPLLDQLRQSILAAAFRGDLTADWREKHPDVEPADDLLARIRAKGLMTNSIQTRRGASAIAAASQDRLDADYDELPRLPQDWSWATLENLTAADRPICYGVVQPGDDDSLGVRLVRVCDMRRDGFTIDTHDLRSVPASVDAEHMRSRLAGGELLVSVVGTIGRTAVVPDALRGANIARAVARVAFTLPWLADWAAFWLNTAHMRDRLNRDSREVARKTLNIGQLATTPIPIPSESEARTILQILRIAWSMTDSISLKIISDRERMASLDTSILASAFRGDLVSQDGNDEPAADLLKRVQIAREPLPARGGVSSRRSRRIAPHETDRDRDAADVEGDAGEADPPIPASADNQPASPGLPEIDDDTLYDDVFTALWSVGPVAKEDAARRVAEHLRAAGRIHFDHLHPNTPLHTQLLAAIDSAVAANHLDRPLPNHVRAIKPDPASYTPDDWQHILLTTLPSTRTDRETAIRTAAEYARDNLGLRFSRLRSDGHIVQALRSAITTAIRRGDVLRHGSTHISRVADDRRAESTK